ncbi:PmoA family protein [candidate division KSB1 bacterium]|nr:PmoA family protein [candidate division KSB1 bacterium]
MKYKTNFLVRKIFYLLLFILFGATSAKDIHSYNGDTFTGIKVEKEENGYTFLENGKRILFYQVKPKSLNGAYTRCHYIHPLYGLDGEILTEDFPQDHPHHRGLFWAWHQVLADDKLIGDSWSLKDFRLDIVESSLIDSTAKIKTLKVKVFWKSPLWTDSLGNEKPLVKEILYLSVYPENKDCRIIDLQTNLYALEQKISIGGSDDEKGYGGFSARFRLPGDIQFTGREGPVTPENISVSAGPWLDFSGSFSEKSISGITIFCNSENPLFPQRWILRQKDSMQNPVFPGRTPVLLNREKPLILCYRLIVHRGDSRNIDLNNLFQNYVDTYSKFHE